MSEEDLNPMRIHATLKGPSGQVLTGHFQPFALKQMVAFFCECEETVAIAKNLRPRAAPVGEPDRNTNRADAGFVCDPCAAALVKAGGASLTLIWGANKIPYAKGVCGKCGAMDTTVAPYPVEWRPVR